MPSVRLYHKFGFLIPLTRKEIGEMARTTPETTMRVLKKFEKQNYLEGYRRKVVIKNFEALPRWPIYQTEGPAFDGRGDKNIGPYRRRLTGTHADTVRIWLAQSPGWDLHSLEESMLAKARIIKQS